MEKMYRRLGKYALDPGNQQTYLGRADQWAQQAGKWENYHEELLEKAVDSGITTKTAATDQSHVSGFDVTDEYNSKASPGKGTITQDDNYRESSHKTEIEFANWLKDNYGGEIHLLTESTEEGKKTPDFLWNGKLWDLKRVSSEKAANSAIRKGIKQINENPGGIMLDFGNNEISLETLKDIINKRMNWYNKHQIDIMIIQKGKVICVLRYKK